MRKLNELISVVDENLSKKTYVELVFRLLEIFIKDFGFDVIKEYFPQITNKHCGVSIYTFWWINHSHQIARETLNYKNVIIEKVKGEWKFDARLDLGHSLDLPNSNYVYHIDKSCEKDNDLNKAFKKEWQALFCNKKNDFVERIKVCLNYGVYNTLLKSRPRLSELDGFKDIREFMKMDYTYVPSKEVLAEAKEILKKLRA